MDTYYVFITNEIDGVDVRQADNYHMAVQCVINFSSNDPEDSWQTVEIIKGRRIYQGE